MKLMTIVLLLSLMGCLTTKVDVQVEPVVIPLPEIPEKPEIEFLQGDELVSLSIEDARELAHYLVDVDAYMESMQIIVDYYIDVLK